MNPIQSKLLTLSNGNLGLYSSISAELCRFLVRDFEATRSVNDDGVFDLARGLNNNMANTARIRGLLLALCNNQLDKYNTLLKEILDTIVTKGRYGKSVRIEEESVLALANALMPFEANQNATNTSKTVDLEQMHSMLQKDMPELAKALFSTPGVNLKHQATK